MADLHETQAGGSDPVAEIEALGERLAAARAAVATRFVGQGAVVDLVLSALLCGGHGLLIGVPGPGQDPARGHALNGDGPPWLAHPVHAGPDAVGHPRRGGA